jgi:hypothetical protein
MGNNDFERVAKYLLVKYINSRMRATAGEKCYKPITEDEVYVVWCCKTLQNNKALLSTTLPDGMYYELTYNGNKDQLYLDAYHKVENVCIEDITSLVSI